MSRPVAGSNVGTSMPPRASVDMRNDQDHFLTEAKGVKVTAADRQAGYELPSTFAERAPASSTDKLAENGSSEESGGTTGPINVPYASRPTSDPHAHFTDGTKRDVERGEGGRRRQRKGATRRRKELKWWQKPRSLIIIMAVTVLVALGVGLGAGLGVSRSRDSSSRSEARSSSFPSSPGQQPAVSQSLIEGAVPAVSRTEEARVAIAQTTVAL